MICGGSLLGGVSGHTDAENKIIDRMNKASLMPHEFLFLLCNVSDRVACITQGHKVDYGKEELCLNEWETNESKHSFEPKIKIQLLPEKAFVNTAPHHIVNAQLSKEAVLLLQTVDPVDLNKKISLRDVMDEHIETTFFKQTDSNRMETGK